MTAPAVIQEENPPPPFFINVCNLSELKDSVISTPLVAGTIPVLPAETPVTELPIIAPLGPEEQASEVGPSMEPTKPEQTFDYDAINVCAVSLCAFSVECDEEQEFEQLYMHSIYNHGMRQEKGYPSCVRDDYEISLDEDPLDLDLKSISEHGNEPLLFTRKEFAKLPDNPVSNPDGLIYTIFVTLLSSIRGLNLSIDFQTLYSCLTYELFTYFMVTLILSLFMTIGYLCDVSLIPLTLLFGVLSHLSINLLRTLWRDVNCYTVLSKQKEPTSFNTPLGFTNGFPIVETI